MLTEAEIATLAALLERARRASGRDRSSALDTITPGDVVQLQPGANSTWGTSLMLVCKVDGNQVRGQLLRPHRGGCREAWAEFSPPQLARVGRAPFPEPEPNIKSWAYQPDRQPERKQPASERSNTRRRNASG
jgi:hypothetical protein